MSKANKIVKGEEPTVGKYIDDEEQELIEAIESSADEPTESYLTPERMDELQAMAGNTMNEIRKRKKQISIRLPVEDLELLKLRAKREGMPYQTLINSILHKAVN
tara:strand:+ start:339 stop:653 length:315 start_codon:yes stop_codon:yes gene_type:complete